MEYSEFKELVGKLCGIDLSHYKSQQMDRRINALMQSWGIGSYEEYLQVLKENPVRFKDFVNKLTINVSEFFRNPERFEELWHKIIPELLLHTRKLKIWSAGCSDGCEPYSISIILNELKAVDGTKIFATDIDQEIIKKAKEAVYAENEMKNIPEDLKQKYFHPYQSFFQLNPEIKKIVEFKLHNLLNDPYETDLDMIICRNVVIYFTEEAKNKIYERFITSLKPGGYLLVGGTEPILQYRKLALEHVMTSFYRKPL